MASKINLANKMEMHYRYKCGDTQKRMAADFGISQPSVSNFIKEVEAKLSDPVFKSAYDRYTATRVAIAAKTTGHTTLVDEAGYPIVSGIAKYKTAVRMLVDENTWTDASGVFGTTGA